MTADLPLRIVQPVETGLDPNVFVPLLRLLAEGQPVELARLATAAGMPIEALQRSLAAVPDTEYDDHGRIVGQGLTLQPTRHRITLAGNQLYTWCALDTVIFPAVLGLPATIESTSPTTGATIRITVTTDGPPVAEPADAVMSVVNPRDMTNIRSSFCNRVDYYESGEQATTAIESQPGAEVLTIPQAANLGIEIAQALLNTESRSD